MLQLDGCTSQCDTITNKLGNINILEEHSPAFNQHMQWQLYTVMASQHTQDMIYQRLLSKTGTMHIDLCPRNYSTCKKSYLIISASKTMNLGCFCLQWFFYFYFYFSSFFKSLSQSDYLSKGGFFHFQGAWPALPHRQLYISAYTRWVCVYSWRGLVDGSGAGGTYWVEGWGRTLNNSSSLGMAYQVRCQAAGK